MPKKSQYSEIKSYYIVISELYKGIRYAEILTITALKIFWFM